MPPLAGEGAQDEQVERALEKIEARGHGVECLQQHHVVFGVECQHQGPHREAGSPSFLHHVSVCCEKGPESGYATAHRGREMHYGRELRLPCPKISSGPKRKNDAFISRASARKRSATDWPTATR